MTRDEGLTPEEYIKKIEEENKKLNIKVASLEGEIKGLNSVIEKLHKEIEEQEAEGGGLFDEIDYRKRECKKLKEFKTKREESMFYFKAQMERAEPKTSSEAEDLQKAKELFEGIYRGELYYLEKENKKLREELSAYDREYFDEDKKAKNIFMEEDTLQELRDLGEI